MKIRLGYVSITNALNITASSPVTYTEFTKNRDFHKINKVICSNLEALYEILLYNKKNNIHFYRMTSNLIPLATKEDVKFNYIKPYQPYYDRISKIIKDNNMRVDFHPDQFCVLNSTKPEVIHNARLILEYHYQLLQAMNIEPKIMIIHVGSSVFGKEQSLKRFIHQFSLLPEYIQKSIAVENDDKVYNVKDCLELCQTLHIPMILDYHHYLANPGNVILDDYLDEIWKTWIGIPKIHFSSPKNKTKKEFRSHHEYIDIAMFLDFIKLLQRHPTDLDIMLESKGKDDALFRLVRQLKYYHIPFIDDTTFRI